MGVLLFQLYLWILARFIVWPLFLPPHSPWGPGSCYLNVLLQETLEEGDGLEKGREREGEMEWGGKNGSRRINRDWFLGRRDTLWQLSGKSLAGIRQSDKRKQLKETEIWQHCRSTVGSAFAQWRNGRLWGWLSICICVEMSSVPPWRQLFISSFCVLTAGSGKCKRPTYFPRSHRSAGPPRRRRNATCAMKHCRAH